MVMFDHLTLCQELKTIVGRISATVSPPHQGWFNILSGFYCQWFFKTHAHVSCCLHVATGKWRPGTESLLTFNSQDAIDGFLQRPTHIAREVFHYLITCVVNIFHLVESKGILKNSTDIVELWHSKIPGGLLSMGSHRVGYNWSDLAAAAAAV